MDRQTIEDARKRVSCAAVLVEAGFLLDRRESSRRALKFRRGGDIVIVTHGGAGWFDPLSDQKGDVFALAGLLDNLPFPASLERVRQLAGLAVTAELYPAPACVSAAPPSERWHYRPALHRLSPAYRYLNEERALPSAVLHPAGSMGLIRQGPAGSAWFRHDDGGGRLSGWEERGPYWRGFSSGGAKSLFRFGPTQPSRLCITEAAIDALSLAAIEDVRRDTLYASTGGGWSPSTAEAIRTAAAGAMLVAATDADPQGEVYADRLREIAEVTGRDFMRLRPRTIDWNEDLKERRGETGLPHTRATASRVKLRPPDGGP